MSELNTISNFSGLKPNKTKYEIVGTGVLNVVKVALYGMKCVNLDSKTVKTFGVHFLYNKNFKQYKNFYKHNCQNRKDYNIMTHKTVNFRGNNYSFQIFSCLLKLTSSTTLQTFVGLEDVFKTSSRYVFKTSSKRLQRNIFSSFKTSWRHLEDLLKMKKKSSRRLQNMPSRRFQDVSWKCFTENICF